MHALQKLLSEQKYFHLHVSYLRIELNVSAVCSQRRVVVVYTPVLASSDGNCCVTYGTYGALIKLLDRFDVFTAVTMNNAVLWDVTPRGSCKNRLLEKLSASFIRVTRIGELGKTLTATSNRRTL
jgi:hypothetical protein